MTAVSLVYFLVGFVVVLRFVGFAGRRFFETLAAGFVLDFVFLLDLGLALRLTFFFLSFVH